MDLWFGRTTRPGPAERVGPLLRQNELVDSDWVDGDVRVLVCENQGTWLWGRTSDGRYVERENATRGNPWVPTGEDEEQFWLHHAAFEALIAMPAARCGLLRDTTSINRLEAFTQPLPCGEWRWIGAQRVLTHQASLVTVLKHDDGGLEVMAGAASERELGWIDGLGIEWDVFDSRSA